MEIKEELQNQLRGMTYPLPSELSAERQVKITDSQLLFLNGKITEEYCRLYMIYQFWLGQILAAKSGLHEINELLEKEGSRKNHGQENFYRKYDQMGMDFFYLCSFAHIERLSEEELRELSPGLEEENIEKAAALVERTYRRVIAYDPDFPERQYQYFPGIHGQGNIKGGACGLVLSLAPEYDEAGMLKSEEKERKRIRTVVRIKELLENRLTDLWGMEVSVFLEE